MTTTKHNNKSNGPFISPSFFYIQEYLQQRSIMAEFNKNIRVHREDLWQ